MSMWILKALGVGCGGVEVDWWQEQKMKLDRGEFVDIEDLSLDLTTRESVLRTVPNLLLG